VVKPFTRNRVAVLFCALVFSLAMAGCHRNDQTSGYSIGWFTVTDEPPPIFASYIVNIDSVVLTGVVNGAVTVVSIPETVDFTKLKDVSELWASASIPNDTYTTATITVDYTSANISVLVNGAPQQATIHDSTGAVPTTLSVTVALDPTNQIFSIPSYATTAAIRVALNFDLAASNRVNFATSPATVTVNPYWTVATSAADKKLIRVRGPLVNTSVTEQTYSVYVRPFFDEVNTAGTLTMFDNASNFSASATASSSPTCPNTTPLFTVNGTSYTGGAGISVLSQTSAGSTMTASYVTYVPTTTPIATAGIFCTVYMVGGSTLEDFYTFGLEGDVIARDGDTVTLRGATLAATSAETVNFYEPDSKVILGSGTLVTEDGIPTNGSLNYNSVSVGDHIIARGICAAGSTNCLINSVLTLDATGTSQTNTGSVRLQPSEAFGSLLSSATGSLEMNLASIGIYPAGVFNFAGTGTSAATDAVPASYLVNTGALALPADLTVGGPVFADGIVAPFGTAPPDFNAAAVPDESAVPADMVVTYATSTLNNASAFTTLDAVAGLSLNLGDSLLRSAQITVGAEVIDVTKLPASPTIVGAPFTPAPPPIKVPTVNLTAADLPPVFLPLFSIGNTANGVSCFNTFSTFVSQLKTDFAAATPSSMAAFTAHGTYDRATNTFTANAINVVLD
jgi:hypothetical protein